ncbi:MULTISPECIES: hypothetical protein [Aquimarina]|uniref:hypothetical protein n=1 Tax=Aquimarina TaxID=290174 RepID=UPI000CDE6F1C|nr:MULTISPECIES: hypothetical protein [Aquimarina]
MAEPKIKFGHPENNSRESIPSDCTTSQRVRLQNEVNKNCKGQISRCLISDQCMVLSDKMKRINKCIQSRTTINETCFKGGDIGHIQAVIQAINSLIRCQTIFATNCSKPVNAPEPIDLPEQMVPISNEDFMEKMTEITGLTGTALIIYLIISEGTRLFPPRNLIPIP